MKTALCGLALVLALAGCTNTTPAPQTPSPTPTISPVAAPVPFNGCVEPLCHIVVATPAPTKAPKPRAAPSPASRSRSTPVQKAGDKIVGTQDVTSYCTGTTTWSGRAPRDGMVAVLDRSIPMYSKVRITGKIRGTAAQRAFGTYYDRTFTVTDHIGHGSDVDIYMTSCSRGRAWGRQHLKITVITH